MKRPCVHCGELYEPTSRHTRGYAQRFCSRKCANAARSARARESYPPRETVLACYCDEGLSDRAFGERYGRSWQWAMSVRKHHGITPDMKPKTPAKWSHSHGYVVTSDGLEHRVVMEQMLGRPLRKGEVVHHIDGNKSNNDPGNLALFPSHSEHMHAERHVAIPKAGTKSQARARRDWTEPRRKVDLEESCRVCGRSGIKIDAAHIIPRSRVGPDEGEHFDNIVPLCHERCHPEFDLGGLDLAPYLTLSEQAYATRLVGMAEAYQRITNTRLVAA